MFLARRWHRPSNEVGTNGSLAMGHALYDPERSTKTNLEKVRNSQKILFTHTSAIAWGQIRRAPAVPNRGSTLASRTCENSPSAPTLQRAQENWNCLMAPSAASHSWTAGPFRQSWARPLVLARTELGWVVAKLRLAGSSGKCGTTHFRCHKNWDAEHKCLCHLPVND